MSKNNSCFLASFLLVVLFCITNVLADEDVGLCCLCENCLRPIRSRANMVVTPDGLTCDQLALEMADPTNESKQGNPVCLRLKRLHYDQCCNSEYVPNPIEKPPTRAPVGEVVDGPYRRCDVCRDGSFPKRPFIITGGTDIPGRPSCQELYWMGRRGQLTERICPVVQNFYEVPCGCISNNSTNSNGVNSTTANNSTRPNNNTGANNTNGSSVHGRNTTRGNAYANNAGNNATSNSTSQGNRTSGNHTKNIRGDGQSGSNSIGKNNEKFVSIKRTSGNTNAINNLSGNKPESGGGGAPELYLPSPAPSKFLFTENSHQESTKDDDTKLYQSRERGNLDRRRLKGRNYS